MACLRANGNKRRYELCDEVIASSNLLRATKLDESPLATYFAPQKADSPLKTHFAPLKLNQTPLKVAQSNKKLPNLDELGSFFQYLLFDSFF